jgi:hypothetical protein
MALEVDSASNRNEYQEELGQLKNSVTSFGFEPATFRLVAYSASSKTTLVVWQFTDVSEEGIILCLQGLGVSHCRQ